MSYYKCSKCAYLKWVGNTGNIKMVICKNCMTKMDPQITEKQIISVEKIFRGEEDETKEIKE